MKALKLHSNPSVSKHNRNESMKLTGQGHKAADEEPLHGEPEK